MTYISYITLLCSAITGVAAVIALLISLAKKSQEPTRELSRRIDALEERMDKHDSQLTMEQDRLRVIEDGSKVTIQALQALLNHGIHGNNIQEMLDRERELREYLVNK